VTSPKTIRDPLADHMLTPQNAAPPRRVGHFHRLDRAGAVRAAVAGRPQHQFAFAQVVPAAHAMPAGETLR
jgi:hypothetical protein